MVLQCLVLGLQNVVDLLEVHQKRPLLLVELLQVGEGCLSEVSEFVLPFAEAEGCLFAGVLGLLELLQLFGQLLGHVII